MAADLVVPTGNFGTFAAPCMIKSISSGTFGSKSGNFMFRNLEAILFGFILIRSCSCPLTTSVKLTPMISISHLKRISVNFLEIGPWKLRHLFFIYSSSLQI